MPTEMKLPATETISARYAELDSWPAGEMLAAMLDSATGSTLMDSLPEDRTAVTTQLSTRFIKPAPVGPLIATVTIVSRDERSAEVEAELAAPDGTVAARATASFRILTRR